MYLFEDDKITAVSQDFEKCGRVTDTGKMAKKENHRGNQKAAGGFIAIRALLLAFVVVAICQIVYGYKCRRGNES